MMRRLERHTSLYISLTLTCLLVALKTEACCDGDWGSSVRGLAARWDAWRHPVLRKRALEITKKQMLNLMGLEDLPRPNRKVIPHVFMLDLYKSLSKGKHNNAELVSTVRGVVDQERFDNSAPNKYHKQFVFNVSTIPVSDKIVSAELRILRQPIPGSEKAYVNQHGVTYKAKLLRTRADNQHNYTPYKPLNSEQLDASTFDITDLEPRWNVFNVKKAIEMWQNSRTKMIHFVLQLQVESLLSGQLIPPEDLGFTKEGRTHNQQALLVVFSNDGRAKSTKLPEVDNSLASNAIPEDTFRSDKPETKSRDENSSHSRVKRGVGSKRKTNTERKDGKKKSRRGLKGKRKRRKERKQFCRRRPLFVDFKQLGWANWILFPRSYNAYFCDGPCIYPIGHYLKPTNHAVVQTLWHAVKPQGAPRACCVPNKLRSFSMLFIDSNNDMVYKKYDDMVVDRCGCE